MSLQPLPLQQDTVYQRKPNVPNEERLQNEALMRALMGELPQPVQPRLFPPRFGYREGVLTIDQVLQLDDSSYMPATNDFSGTPAGYQGSHTPALNWW